jgi:N-carbamoyl-L-amino-acid hydrolase
MEVMMLRVNGPRLLQNIRSLAKIGQTPEGGVSRPAFSEADVAGRAWFKRTVEATGLEFRTDSAGNLSAILPVADPDAQTLLVGSHLDTVPNGGRFDGALGVLAALEALQTLQVAQLNLPYHLEAISFTDEEAAMLSMVGSRALAGLLAKTDLDRARQGPEALTAGLARLGLTSDGLLSARRDPATVVGYLELHIEQGPRLAEEGVQIGVVTSIVGIRSFWLTFTGQASHSGTTPMESRADACWGAADFVTQARARVMTHFLPGVMNCGQIELQPGGFNVIPAKARLALEIRHGSEETLDRMEADLLELAGRVAAAYRLTVSAIPQGTVKAVGLHPGMIGAMEQAIDHLGLTRTRLLSFAGHDAQNLSAFTATGLIFVPSFGLSHSPTEDVRDEDVINGANVVLHTLLRLSNDA